MQSLVNNQGVILVVDDTPNNLNVMHKLLKEAGYKIFIAQNGEQALKTAALARPDLILLDVMMPHLDGFTVCQRLKSQVLTQDISVIFMTALSDGQNKIKGLELGAVDYITKPFNREEVLARVHTHLTIAKLQKTLAEQNKQLQRQAEEEKLFTRISEHIRQSLNLHQILTTASQEVQQLLNCDRVVVYSLTSQNTHLEVQIVSQGTPQLRFPTSAWPSLYSEGEKTPQEQQGYFPADHHPQKVIESKLPQLHPELGIQAELVIPIWLETSQPTQTKKAEGYQPTIESGSTFPDTSITQEDSVNNLSCLSLWGYLLIHQCHSPRQWLESEIHLLQRLSTQLAIAIQQALLYQKLQQANLELQELNVRDPLTSIFNRRYFDQQLNLEWRRLMRHPSPLSLIMCDVDHFKLYNDIYGHQQGDECLRQIASALASCSRRAADLVCRYGGEEFAVILPQTELTGAVKVAESIKTRVTELNLEHRGSPVSKIVTISLGVACTTPGRHLDAQGLIQNADRALYTAKSRGRNCWAVYNPKFNS